MPFVNFPIMCMTCKGTGKVTHVCAFRKYQDDLAISCPTCNGEGELKNNVWVNEEIEETKEIVNENKNSIQPIIEYEDSKFINENIDKLVNNIKQKKIKKD